LIDDTIYIHTIKRQKENATELQKGTKMNRTQYKTSTKRD